MAEKAERKKKAEKEQDKTGIIVVKSDTNQDKAKQLLSEKLEKAKDGRILLDNDDMQKVIEAAKDQEEQAGKKHGNHADAVGANLDLKI